MAGQPNEFSSSKIVSSAIRLRDVPLISMGLVKPDEKDFEVIVEFDRESNMYKK